MLLYFRSKPGWNKFDLLNVSPKFESAIHSQLFQNYQCKVYFQFINFYLGCI